MGYPHGEDFEIRELEAEDVDQSPHRPDVAVYADRVVIAGATYPRCSRALGIARCGGAVTVLGASDCGGH